METSLDALAESEKELGLDITQEQIEELKAHMTTLTMKWQRQ